MNILVTGASGFIGVNLCKRLNFFNHNIIALGRKNENVPINNKFICKPLNKINWSNFKNIDITFHLAANNDTLDKDIEAMMETNYTAPVRMFHELELNGCKQFVYASSTAVYGDSYPPYKEDTTKLNPLNAYAESKAKFDNFAMSFATMTKANVIGLRYCNIYGPGESHKGHRASMVYQLLKQMTNGKRPRIFQHGEQKRDWIYVEDVVDANILASHAKHSGVFNCGSGKEYSFNDMVKIINEFLSTNYEPEYIENPYIEQYQSHTCCDMSKALKMLGFKPKRQLREGIEDFIPKEFKK